MNQTPFHGNKREQTMKLLRLQKAKEEHDKARHMTIVEYAKHLGYKEYKTKEVNGQTYFIVLSKGMGLSAALLATTKDGPVVRIDQSLVDLIENKKAIGALVLHELGHYFLRHKLCVDERELEELYAADQFVLSKMDASELMVALEKINSVGKKSKQLDLRIKKLKSIEAA